MLRSILSPDPLNYLQDGPCHHLSFIDEKLAQYQRQCE